MTTGPVRTCLGCRRARPKRLLIRLVRDTSGVVRVDRTAAAPGRGAYVCPDGACVERMLKAAALSRAFRKRSDAGPDLEADVRNRGWGTGPALEGSRRVDASRAGWAVDGEIIYGTA